MEGKKDNFFFKNILDFHKKEAGICEKDPPTKCAKSYEILERKKERKRIIIIKNNNNNNNKKRSKNKKSPNVVWET
jgi:hypothetical protein